jgi:hypothetical protein
MRWSRVNFGAAALSGVLRWGVEVRAAAAGGIAFG